MSAPKKLAAYWDWPSGAVVPDARIVVCAPGLLDTEDGAVARHDGALIGYATTFVVPSLDFSGWRESNMIGCIPALHVRTQADLTRLSDLLAVQAERRALVVSPEEVLRSNDGPAHADIPYGMACGLDVDVVFIVGLDKPLRPDWVRSIVEQCRTAGVPVVFLGWGAWIPHSQAAGVDTLARNATATLRDDPEVWFRVGTARSGALLDGATVEDVPAWLARSGATDDVMWLGGEG